jgi:hypothetical protein
MYRPPWNTSRCMARSPATNNHFYSGRRNLNRQTVTNAQWLSVHTQLHVLENHAVSFTNRTCDRCYKPGQHPTNILAKDNTIRCSRRICCEVQNNETSTCGLPMRARGCSPKGGLQGRACWQVVNELTTISLDIHFSFKTWINPVLERGCKLQDVQDFS